jgi:hypothetical protein
MLCQKKKSFKNKGLMNPPNPLILVRKLFRHHLPGFGFDVFQEVKLGLLVDHGPGA